ncbi:LLM class flavin-dependent oxidoreductase [Streptacidiphilus anmyonensis]|uniref:LLM class flavin-dependent oxidoreductase n=1 Tax=Streptacidiphilus anmyonensis TaxID=405782 RepID=UPI0005A9D9CA|nr:LLM class flavin-dependent oxidoreductase [Streptacidiphilus anmyonensis]
MRMRAGLVLPLYDDPWTDPVGRILHLADLGIPGIWVRDIPLLQNDGVDRGAGFDPVALLSNALGRGVPFDEVGTAVLCLSYRQPLTLAQAVATLQTLSGNRLVVGVGAGVRTSVNEVYGLDPDLRRRHFIHAVRVLDDLLRRGAASLPETVRFECAPDASPPPLLLASNDPVALRELTGLADGWMTNYVTPQRVPTELHAICPQAVPLPSTMQLTLAVSTADQDLPPTPEPYGRLTLVRVGARQLPGLLERYDEAGLARVLVHLPLDNADGSQLAALASALRVTDLATTGV